MSSDNFHYGIVGEGPDATIAAYGSSVGMGIPDEAQKAWSCPTCTFWNTETMGHFCSMCGSRRFVENAQAQRNAQRPSERRAIHSQQERYSRDTNEAYTLSPEVGHQRKTLGSLPEEASPRNTICLGKVQEPLLSSDEVRSSLMGLDKSLSMMDILDDMDPDAPSKNGTEEKQALNAKDFQMSFANWSVSDNGAWTCEACTFVNTNALHLQCEICGQSRPSQSGGKKSQKVMQDMMEQSFRTGQNDFLKQQQEKIEEIETRVISSERLHEINAYQEEMLNQNSEPRHEEPNDVDRREMAERAKMAEEHIHRVEQVGRQEREEQDRMEQLLEGRRRQLGMQRMPTERALHYRDTHETQPSAQGGYPNRGALNPQTTPQQGYPGAIHRGPSHPGPSHRPSSTQGYNPGRGPQTNTTGGGRGHMDRAPSQTNSFARSQVRAQERMLSQWKETTRSRERDIADIRRRQQEITDRWQRDMM